MRMTEQEFEFRKERKEVCMLYALVEVKEKRMPKEQAFNESKHQRLTRSDLDSWTIEFLEDTYKAAQLLYDRFEWFRQGVAARTLDLHNAGAI